MLYCIFTLRNNVQFITENNIIKKNILTIFLFSNKNAHNLLSDILSWDVNIEAI